MPPEQPHWVKSALNFRDFGGYASSHGGRVRSDVLFRSAQLDAAGPDVEGLVARLGIGAIIDLRSDAEDRALDSPALQGFNGQYLYASGASDPMPLAMQAMAGLSSVADVDRLISDIYSQFPISAKFRESMALYVRALTRDTTSSLVHCMAGKDRTGVAVALVQHLLGVHPDDVIAEYLKTNDAGEARIEAGVAILRARFGAGLSDAIMHEIMAVRLAHLDSAMAAIDREFGGVRRYFTELGIEEKDIITLRDLYLA